MNPETAFETACTTAKSQTFYLATNVMYGQRLESRGTINLALFDHPAASRGLTLSYFQSEYCSHVHHTPPPGINVYKIDGVNVRPGPEILSCNITVFLDIVSA